MSIQTNIRQSKNFAKLLAFFNTPHKKKQGVIVTAHGTTQDIQKIILQEIEKEYKASILYATQKNTNTIRFLESITAVSEFSYQKLQECLEKKHFERVDTVTAKGEYAIRGDTISFWPSIYTHPIRAHFWGEELEYLEQYDESYQKSLAKLQQLSLGNENLLDQVDDKELLFMSSTRYPQHKIKLVFDNRETDSTKHHINFGFTYPALYFNRLDIFKKQVQQKIRSRWEVYIYTKHKKLLPKKLHSLIIDKQLTAGFENATLKMAAYTDKELFGTIFVSFEKEKSNKATNRYLAQLEGEINVGDYIVHEDYGIATYKGMKQKKIMGRMRNYLLLEYAEGDKLSVPLQQIHKITKFIGPDRVKPKITRLGKTAWKTITKRVKKSVSIIAKELLIHYAKREVADGISFTEHEWEDAFAAEFEFEETPDQERVIQEVLQDMHKTHPMNRLIVGDVGFGKTEVAMRAAFRAVMNGTQVAVLCPTTILVSQHYSVFTDRMQNYPIKIAPLSRLGSRKENQHTIEKLKTGTIDIVIGTHRLLSHDIAFSKLGLLVIDEEQKFGVKQKEKIKKMAYHADVLSMSATPIPRTLSMSLSNLRDISIITTPPPGRKAIKTYLHKKNWNKIAQAIAREVKRSGQIYFVHNEVRTIQSIQNKLQTLLPDVRFAVAHGQMHPQTLAKVMRQFHTKKFDCLICTTIIENGIDLKNVNTIIIHKAERFGLAQLYQLRGRVGRSKRQAYCYLFYSNKNLFSKTIQHKNSRGVYRKLPYSKAKERLQAIFKAQDVGSGFKIASRDMEIRGAGNLLGKEQHGNISAVGLGLYTQLLAAEIEKMKQEKA